MKSTEKKPATGKLAVCLILAIIAGGMGVFTAVADVEQGSGIMGTLFIAFLGAIIAIQVIPGMMLFGMMLKGLASLFRKEEATRKVE